MMIVSDNFTIHNMNEASRSVNDASRSTIDDFRVMLQIVAFYDRCDIHDDHKYGAVSIVRNTYSSNIQGSANS